MQTLQGEQQVLMLELVDAAYDADAHRLIYGATKLSEYNGEMLKHPAMQKQAVEVPEAFGRASLFIDSGDVCVKIGFFSFCP